MDSLSQGVMLARDVFGRPEDIARLDLMSVVRSKDVDQSVVHEKYDIPHEHTSELCHTLLMFGWSRTPAHVEFTQEAEQAARIVSDRLGTKYQSDIKIVEAMEQRVKVARVAGALAVMTYSTDDGTMLTINADHVYAAEKLMERLFDDPAMSYNEYADNYRFKQQVKSRPLLADWCTKQPEELLRAMLSQATIRMFDIQNYGDYTRDDAQSCVSFLLQQRALFVSERQDYVKNSEFVTLLREALIAGKFADPKTSHFNAKDKRGNKSAPADY